MFCLLCKSTHPVLKLFSKRSRSFYISPSDLFSRGLLVCNLAFSIFNCFTNKSSILLFLTNIYKSIQTYIRIWHFWMPCDIVRITTYYFQLSIIWNVYLVNKKDVERTLFLTLAIKLKFRDRTCYDLKKYLLY